MRPATDRTSGVSSSLMATLTPRIWKKLRGAYDTTALLALVERFDRLRPLFSPDGGIRDELLRLHAMAHTVINDAPLTGTANGTDICEAAQDLIEELFGVVGVIHAALETLQPLADLAPVEE